MSALRSLLNLTSSQFRQNTTTLFERHFPIPMSLWWIFTMFITATYTSKLYVHFLTGETPPTINSLDELISDSDTKVYLVKGTNLVDMFRNGSNRLYRGVWNKISSGRGGFVEFHNWHDIVVKSNERNYIIMNKIESEYTKLTGQPIHIGRDEFNAVEFAFVMSKSLSLSYKEKINKVMTILQESGTLQKLNYKYTLESTRKDQLLQPHRHIVKPIIVESMFTMFKIFLSCLLLCGFVMFVEIFVHHY